MIVRFTESAIEFYNFLVAFVPVATPAFGTSRGTAGARWSRDGAHSGSLLIMLKYQYFSSLCTAFPAGACAPDGPGIAPPMLYTHVQVA